MHNNKQQYTSDMLLQQSLRSSKNKITFHHIHKVNEKIGIICGKSLSIIHSEYEHIRYDCKISLKHQQEIVSVTNENRESDNSTITTNIEKSKIIVKHINWPYFILFLRKQGRAHNVFNELETECA